MPFPKVGARNLKLSENNKILDKINASFETPNKKRT